MANANNESGKVNPTAKNSNGNSKNTPPKGSAKPQIKRFSPNKNNNMVTGGIIAGIILLMFLGYSVVADIAAKGEEVGVTQFFTEIKEEKYEDPTIILSDGVLILEGKTTKEINGEDKDVVVREHAVVADDYSNRDLNEDLADYEIALESVNVEVKKGTNVDLVLNVLWLAVIVVTVFVIYNMVRGMQKNGGQLMDFGQSKARLLFGKKTGITFDDVAGIDDVKEDLIEVVDFLKNPKKYTAVGARIPKGVLLVGQPGTGKTLLAKAVAGEAGVPFFHTSGSEFEEMLVGAGASRVRDLFMKAKRAAPCIIFIDEIDAVAKKRGTVLHSGAGEQTLNQILVEMDGLEERENVIVLAATNRPDVLDPAILRPGRFDRSVTVQMPDFEGRLEIMAVHSKDKKFAEGVDLEKVARKTIGYSGADLENLLNEAAIKTAREGRKELTQEDLMFAYLKVGIGRERKNKRVEKDIKRIAYHESGHAVVSKMTPDTSPVEKVSIVSRGQTGGVTVYVPEDDRSLTTRGEMLAKLRSVVGGKIAEEVFLGDMSTGASGDIEQATEMAKAMIQKYGMSEDLGFVKYGSLQEVTNMGYSYGGERDYSEATAKAIDDAVKSMIDDAQTDARKILTDNKDKVEKLVELLLEKEDVDSEEFNRIFE